MNQRRRNKSDNGKTAPNTKARVLFIGIVFSLLYGVVGAKAVYLQVFESPWLTRKAADQYQKALVAKGKRGTIYDTKMREMAISVDTASIAAYPAHIKNPDRTATVLARHLGTAKKNLARKLKSDRSFVWIKRHVSPKEKASVKELDLDGIDFIPEHARAYPNRTIAAQVLGFSGIDGQGLEGVEFLFNDYLKGRELKQVVVTDALGRGFDARQKLLADYAGNNLVLTIDRTIQYIAESALSQAAQQYSARSGIAIVMAPKTGEILAMAHYPQFNPNAFGDYSRQLWRNRAITDAFEPGSTMKIFLAAAAIESGMCTPSTIFYCEDGAYRINRNMVHDTHSHGWLSLQQIIKFSSNIGTIKIAEAIGKKLLYNNLRAFGFGEKTGIDCPGETSGSLSSPNRWTRIDTGAISFGQGIAVSAIQLISAAAALANDGVMMQPRIVKAVTDSNGRLIQSFPPRKVRNIISPDSARTVRRIMHTVVTEGGTGTNAAVEGYSVCGKTGTAQKIDASGCYAKDRFVASFIGFAPSRCPEIAVLVVIDEPQEEHYGGIVAAPAFGKITRDTLHYLNITPEKKLQPDWSKKLSVARLTGGAQ